MSRSDAAPVVRKDVRLARARERYERTPRALDERLTALARGDRGCLGDVLTVAGALVTPILGVWASRAGLPHWLPVAGVALVVAGIAVQRRAQGRSCRERTQALRSAPLVCAWSIEADDAAAATERPIAVCATDPELRFDSAYLARVARAVADARRSGSTAFGDLFANAFAIGFRPVPPELGAREHTYAVRVPVGAHRGADGVLEGARGEPPAERCIPCIPCIVDVERGLVEPVG